VLWEGVAIVLDAKAIHAVEEAVSVRGVEVAAAVVFVDKAGQVLARLAAK
jgi:hypothetical protein